MMRFVRKRPGSNLRQISLASGFTMQTVRKILIDFQEKNVIRDVFDSPYHHRRNFEITFTEKGLRILNLIDELEKTIMEEKC